MTVSRVPRWLCSYSRDVRTVPAGRWWSAVRVPAALGALVLELLGGETGAVIEDGYGGILYWLVPPGAAVGWKPPGVQVLGRGSHVAVPPPGRTSGPGLYWRVPLSHDSYWTNAERLRAALAEAVATASRNGRSPRPV
ncbi:hypothetical protein QBB33_36345 [Streptomyces scabiei]|uniref:hypothetical protein n=1 Tax=Streptomyces scabiei TaxID=1930 RepID=UPI001B308545|nr:MULTISPECIES: hypothetical protein [Streptomyces]MBP5870630.1 hypothetical protein [Streptomyces sp. LBUM 1485]MBP5913483.1 hypothetical protein [Streptomyces sp. LBUM 1486]MDX3033402.1 hypothetical protein [Streptomyces scabiei]MDX3211464.1 hypothetical protein [Streptomyces scabiei]QTU57121.1 hypothetical protein F3K21_33690 [Streptomyces sp. LBUM 1480]